MILSLAVIRSLASIAGKEFVDETLEHERRLRLIDAAAILQIGISPAGADADVFATQESLRLHARETVLGNLVVLLVKAHGDDGLVVLGIKADRLHDADAHPRHGNGRAGLKIPDIRSEERRVGKECRS